jgi:hypothetical protein
MMFTPYSAKSYGVDVKFKDPTDPWEIAKGTLPGVPHAGVLTTTMFLNRFPTTATNRNRARARVVYKFFLDTDVLKLGARPLDPTSIKTVNPTMNNPNCTVCHELIDPVAATFQNYQVRNDYAPLETTEQMTWYTGHAPPGFGDKPLPEGDEKIAEQWLAKQIVADDRFAQSAVRAVWTGLTGQELLSEPFDAAHPDYVQALEAFQVQDRSSSRSPPSCATTTTTSSWSSRRSSRPTTSGPRTSRTACSATSARPELASTSAPRSS